MCPPYLLEDGRWLAPALLVGIIDDMTISLVNQFTPFLTRAKRAMEVCALVLVAWEKEVVAIDFEGVKVVSPSFANALIMNLLERCENDFEEFQRRVQLINLDPSANSAIEQAVSRWNHQIRLSSYELST